MKQMEASVGGGLVLHSINPNSAQDIILNMPPPAPAIVIHVSNGMIPVFDGYIVHAVARDTRFVPQQMFDEPPPLVDIEDEPCNPQVDPIHIIIGTTSHFKI